MARQITLTLSDEEYGNYLNGLEAIQAIKAQYPQWDKAKILLVFNSPGCQIPMVRVPLPEMEEPLLDGWYSPEHKQFYRQAIRQVNAILREASEGGD